MNEKLKAFQKAYEDLINELGKEPIKFFDNIGKPWEPIHGRPWYWQNLYLIKSLSFSKEDENFNLLYNNYSCFPTKEEAQKTAYRERTRRKLELIAKRLNGDWKPDWQDLYTYKYCLRYTISGIYISYNWDTSLGQVFFQSEDKAQKALDAMTDDELCALFDVEEIKR